MAQIKITRECPGCGGALIVRYRHKDQHPFLGCQRYPDCAYTERIPLDLKKHLRGDPMLPGMEFEEMEG